jgi:hypothetical protein
MLGHPPCLAARGGALRLGAGHDQAGAGPARGSGWCHGSESESPARPACGVRSGRRAGSPGMPACYSDALAPCQYAGARAPLAVPPGSSPRPRARDTAMPASGKGPGALRRHWHQHPGPKRAQAACAANCAWRAPPLPRADDRAARCDSVGTATCPLELEAQGPSPRHGVLSEPPAPWALYPSYCDREARAPSSAEARSSSCRPGGRAPLSEGNLKQNPSSSRRRICRSAVSRMCVFECASMSVAVSVAAACGFTVITA